MKRSIALSAVFIVAIAGALVQSCGGKAACSPSNCAGGCCDTGGTCQTGASDLACGAVGAQCATCAVGQHCLAGACSSGSGGGSGGGGGGSGMMTCSDTCDGCCDGEMCRAGGTDAQCGAVGNACQACAGAQHCTATGCISAACPGCVKPDGTCLLQTNDTQCGTSGQSCQDCTKSGQTCSMFGLCTGGTCGGCRDVYGICHAGTQRSACGKGPNCMTCSVGLACDGTNCVLGAAGGGAAGTGGGGSGTGGGTGTGGSSGTGGGSTFSDGGACSGMQNGMSCACPTSDCTELPCCGGLTCNSSVHACY